MLGCRGKIVLTLLVFSLELRADLVKTCLEALSAPFRKAPVVDTSSRFSGPPPIAESISFEMSPPRPDPKFPGAYLYTVKPKGPNRFETRDLVAFVKRFPESANRLGIKVLPDGSFEYPDYRGRNERMKELQKEKPKGVLIPQIFSWGYAGAKEATHDEIGRRLAEGKGTTESLEGSLHYHDIFGHGPGYWIIPEAVRDRIEARLKFLHACLDNPQLSKLDGFRDFLRKEIRREAETFDGVSGYLFRQLESGNDNELYLSFASLSRSVGETYEGIEEFLESRYPLGISNRQREILESLYKPYRLQPTIDERALIAELARLR